MAVMLSPDGIASVALTAVNVTPGPRLLTTNVYTPVCPRVKEAWWDFEIVRSGGSLTRVGSVPVKGIAEPPPDTVTEFTEFVAAPSPTFRVMIMGG